jgi:hypothetical protein
VPADPKPRPFKVDAWLEEAKYFKVLFITEYQDA